MAQKKKTAPKKSSKTTNKNTPEKGKGIKSLFSSEHKQIASLIGFFVALFMCAVVFIDAGSVWGALRNFTFGLFGLNAFIVPFFIGFVCIVSAIGKDSKKYKIKVIEGFILFTLIVSFLHIVCTNAEHTYGEQIAVSMLGIGAYNM